MFSHYGLFWSERDVFWGRQKVPGQLLGKEKSRLARRGAPTNEEKKKTKDFRDFVGLYCLYGNGELIYVGESGLNTHENLFKRLKSHRSGPLAGRWDSFSWFGRENCEDSCELRTAFAHLEAAVIAIINPGFNKQSGAFKGAIQVYQVPHPESEGNLETKIDRLYTALLELKAPPPDSKD